MSVIDRLRGSGPDGRLDADALVERVIGLRQFVLAAEGRIPEQDLVAARTLVDRVGERLALSKAHTVVALAGATGSGKSSLFNALSGIQISRVGVRRPTTGIAHACVWGSQGAAPLLDWLGVPPSRRFMRESALDGDDQSALRGLVLLDLPDFDSVEASHRVEVDRLLRLVDLVVWVMDPQKYADRVVHEQYLRQFARHREVMVVVLNQADRLTRADAERCLGDLRSLLDADGLAGIPSFTTSAKGQPGLAPLRAQLEKAVADRQAALQRLAGDVDGVVAGLRPFVDVEVDPDRIDRPAVDRLAGALGAAAGVPIVADAAERSYRHRAAASLGWPLLRWARRVRPDPLRRLHLSPASPSELPAATSLPESTAAQRAAVAMAARALAADASQGLPVPWPEAVLEASRSRLRDVPDALDVAIARADLGQADTPVWWRLAGFLQWLGALAALGGLTWLVARYLLLFLGLPDIRGPEVGRLPLPTLLLGGGLLFGLLLSIVVRPFVGIGGRRARNRVERRLRTAIAEVADGYIVAPIGEVLTAYADARRALRTAAS